MSLGSLWYYPLNGVLGYVPTFNLSLLQVDLIHRVLCLRHALLLEGNTEKTVTKREIKEVFKHLVFDTRFLFTFFVWTVHRSWFLFENMAKNLGLIEATEKKLSRIRPPKLSQDH